MRRAGYLHNVYTDNIDRLFDLAGIHDYEQVRGSGVVNEYHPVIFSPESNALLVVGVSADRRGIIRQARERGMRLVVINPYIPVSPGAKNLDYLRAGDIYYKMRAGEALTRIVEETLNLRVR
jgi:NAD-dependent SIR2 family protein deacetylase